MPSPASATLAVRHRRTRAALETLSLDALVVTNPVNIRYLTNHAGSAGVAVLTSDAVHLLIDFRYQESVRQLQASSAACPGLRTREVPGSYEQALVDLLIELGLSGVGFEAAHVPVARYEWWRAALAASAEAVILRSTDGLVERGRLIKDADEQERLREAASRLTPVAASVIDAIRPGMREREVAGKLESAMRDAGFERPAFDTIVASGPNSALPHYRAGDRLLTPGDLVVLDFGGVLDGYCSDLTRTVSIGRPSEEARRVYAAVLDAQLAAIAAVKPGVAASAVDAAARTLLDSRGLGQAFGHGTGHGLGLDVHETPRISRPLPGAPATPLEDGMVFTIEPGAYIAGWGGVRIEDDVLVTASGCDVLTAVPKALRIIG